MRAEILKGLNTLNREDIESAINKLKRNEKHEFSDSTHYDLVFNSENFPPKAVIGLALQAKNGKTIYPEDFKGGLDSKCFKVLEKNGFKVARKKNVAWLLQGNPEIFDIDAYLGEASYKYWSCPKFHKEIQAGDKAFFFRCGKGAAVIAKGTILEVPVSREQVKHPELLSEINKENKIVFKVGVNIDETRVSNPKNTVSRYDLLHDTLLKENSLITSRQSSVFKLTEGERNSLENLWLKRKTEPRLIEIYNVVAEEKGVVLASRKAFIQSLGATCKNWQWSWSFVNNEKRFVIFGEWQGRSDRKPGLIFSSDWEIRNGKQNKGFRQGLEHIRLVEEEGFKLFTFAMIADEANEDTEGRVRIKSFTRSAVEKTLVSKQDGWYVAPIGDGKGEQIDAIEIETESQNSWSNEELRASVEGYIKMLNMQRTGEPFNKTGIYRTLALKTGRSLKSIEYRMQNISFALQLSGRSTVTGLAPARNVGTHVLEKIEDILSEIEGRLPDPVIKFNAEVEKLKLRPEKVIPQGTRSPLRKEITSNGYVRSPEVVAWVLSYANGKCEACGKNGPFITNNDDFFLEVHHVRFLSEGGADTIENAVASCPNCHRSFHHSKDKMKLTEQLYKNVKRLVNAAEGNI